jgi:deoxyguanosine kinase
MLREHFDTGLLLEVFEENPFLSKFYQARARYAFQTQMFFLLSRYRQQQQVPEFLHAQTLISDYMFAKDWLFAQLNLEGDEWEIYKQIHGALAQQITPAKLIVYLQADTEVLMGRIAQRDRPYERDMDRNYIEALRQAYEQFFAGYQDTPVLYIDTNALNFVTNHQDFQAVAGQIQSALQDGLGQRLPGELLVEGKAAQKSRHSLPEYQKFHIELDRAKGFITDVYFNYLCLAEEIGELGSELAKMWRDEVKMDLQGQTPDQVRQAVMSKRKSALETELADCMAYLLKIANYADIDLEAAYVEKMKWNMTRTW